MKFAAAWPLLALLSVSAVHASSQALPGAIRTTLIQPNTSLNEAIRRLGQVTRVPVGFESVPAVDALVALKTPLDLAQVKQPLLAVSRLADVGTYIVSEVGGALIVRPISTKSGSSWLDEPLVSPKPSGTLVDVLNLLREAAGPRRSLQVRPIGLLAKQVPLTGGTAAELLSNAVAAHGAAGWSVSYRPNVNRGESGLTRFLEIYSYDGGQVGISLGIVAGSGEGR
jgi:hypothetical protein